MSACVTSVLLIAVTLLCAARPAEAQARVQLPCERLSGVASCIECSTAPSKCYLCQKNTSPVYNAAGLITACRPAVVGPACLAASGDANCARCDATNPQWCQECAFGFYFDAKYKCIKGFCPQFSRNPGCSVCNWDGMCTRCANANLILMPSNAVWSNVAMPESKCLTLAQLNTEARSITGKDAVLPSGCSEVDTLFRCSQCQVGYSLTGGKCVPYATGNKCKATLRFRQYCARCNAAGDQCLQCTGGRSLSDGLCSLPCKMLFGIGCLNCNRFYCTRVDTLFLNGR